MCRIAAYLGAPCTLGTFVSEPSHGLARQSWDSREMVSATVNADGWGAAWLDAARRPAVYRQVLPIWADVNLEPLGRSLRSPLWLANVRSATTGLGTDYANTQPFVDDELLFTHNGFIDRFAHTLRARMRAELDPAIEITINGNTDSEYLFALIRQQAGSLAARVRATLAKLREWLLETPDVRALLNVIVSDGNTLVATRAAFNGDAPSLYVNAQWQDGAVIASEAFDNQSGWERVEAQQMIIVRAGQAPVRECL
ncbi:ergothioneine biosynthesis protein EgtC [Salinisphaera aquimarina]|uniref:Ergothioneine biosynthesis protein EgtC n=1 Tax=Salinisphaera aquimarina TaxID=2094031 RepID=A0ABV7ESR7_9GAMM